MADYEDLPYVVIERHGGGFEAFFWGALLGAGAALLLAPRSGAETQREIRDTARRVRGAAEDRVTDARETVLGAVDRTRTRVEDRVSTVRGAIEERADQAREAVRVGRDAARQARSELERRVHEAKTAYRAGVEAVRQPTGPEVDLAVVVTEVTVEAAPADGSL